MDVEYKNDIYYENGRTTNEVEVVSKFSDSQSNIDTFIQKDLLYITKNFLLRRDVGEEAAEKRKSITDLLLNDYGDNQESDKEFLELFDKKYFDYTKPIKLIYNLVKSNFTEEGIILDFFSGSATTAPCRNATQLRRWRQPQVHHGAAPWKDRREERSFQGWL